MPTQLFSAHSTTTSVFLRMKVAMRRVKEYLLMLGTVELAALSSGVEVQPSSTTGANWMFQVNVE